MEQEIYKKRRQKLNQSLADGEALLILSGSKSEKSPHSFRALSDFIYYTGLNIENAALLLSEGQEILFVTRGDEAKILWDGLSYDENELHALGFSSFRFREELISILARRRFQKIHTNKISAPGQEDFSDEMKKIRLLKDENEIAILRKAASLSAGVHRELISFIQEGQSEREIALFIDSRFRAQGSERNAYESIVASRERSCTLHGLASLRRLGKQELVLIDAACELDFYASDITRVYSSSRRLTKAQEKIYDLVLAVQKNILAEVRPGTTLNELHSLARQGLQQGLAHLNLRGARLDSLYPHRTSHWLGLDVHDTSGLNHDLRLEENMCFTVEPGLYFRADLGIQDYSGIGVRIEDDVRVTATGCEILTAQAPKEKVELFL